MTTMTPRIVTCFRPTVLRAAAAPGEPDQTTEPSGSSGRRLVGLAVPWDSPAWSGLEGGDALGDDDQAAQVAFAPGSITIPEGRGVPVVLNHDRDDLVGKLESMTSTDAGLEVTLRIASTGDGDDVLTLASEGILDGLSVCAAITAAEQRDAVLYVSAAYLLEVTLTAFPANPNARLIAASLPNPRYAMTTTTTTEPVTPPPAPVEPAPVEPTTPPPAVIQAAPRVAAPQQTVTASAVVSPRLPSPGVYLTEYVRASLTRDWSEFRRVMQDLPADQTTATAAGLLPVPITQPVINLRVAKRPVWQSLQSRAMPERGKTFERPVITDHVKVEIQAKEKAVLPSNPMTISGQTVMKDTRGGTLDVSFQVIDWTEPAIMGLLVEDFADSYVLDTETVACATLGKAYKGKATEVDPADPAAVVKAFYDAAAAVYPAMNLFPDRVWASLDQWAMLGALCDKNGRPLFPHVAPQNAIGDAAGIASDAMNLLGVKVVVSPSLAPGTLLVGRSNAVEVYEQIKGMIQVINVTQLGLDLAYYGYTATNIVTDKAIVPLKLKLKTPGP